MRQHAILDLFENIVDPDQLASEEASWSESTKFSKELVPGYSKTENVSLMFNLFDIVSHVQTKS